MNERKSEDKKTYGKRVRQTLVKLPPAIKGETNISDWPVSPHWLFLSP